MKNIILLFIVISLLFSCTTQKKATNYFREHPEQLAPLCADEFPVKDSLVVRDSVRFDTLYLESDPIILKDSFYLKGDTIVKQVTKQCPPVQTIVKTILRDTIHYQRDRAYEQVLESLLAVEKAKNAKLQQVVAQLQDKVKKRNKAILWLLIIIAGETVWIFRRPILSIINPIKGIPPIS